MFNGQPADVVLAHIKDLTGDVDAHSIGAPAYTTEKQVFHTDVGDVIALFALESAEEGGESFLASSWTVYNELAATRPDLIHTLAEPWDFDESVAVPSHIVLIMFNERMKRFGKTGPPGYTSRPLLHYQRATADGDPERLIIQYARRALTGYWGLPRSPNIPPITEAQAEALDALHFAAEKHAVSLDFRPGDVQFVNNLSIFHARGSFRNSAEKQCVFFLSLSFSVFLFVVFVLRCVRANGLVDAIWCGCGSATTSLPGRRRRVCRAAGTACIRA